MVSIRIPLELFRNYELNMFRIAYLDCYPRSSAEQATSLRSVRNDTATNYKCLISLSICFLISLSLRTCFFSIFLISLPIQIFSLIKPRLLINISSGIIVVPDLSSAEDTFASSFLVINNFLLPLGS